MPLYILHYINLLGIVFPTHQNHKDKDKVSLPTDFTLIGIEPGSMHEYIIGIK